MKRYLILQNFMFILACATFTFCTSQGNVSDKNKIANPQEEVTSSFLSEYPLITWARKSPVEIGCMLEKGLSYHDQTFNCSNTSYVPNNDPNSEEYYAGIAFPEQLISKIHKSIEMIGLKFEHGALQQIDITFKDSLLKSEIQKQFNLPTSSANYPQNVMAISYGESIFSKEKPKNPDYTKWLTIIGFEHMGAGDYDSTGVDL